ncbi:sigma 54-interacting transcriptional regulator [Vibrio lentus]|nr:sigma 54-interacting transcriptional regulator [Vibrio lentus]
MAKTDANVMVLEPSGSGKEVMSRYIHNASRAVKMVRLLRLTVLQRFQIICWKRHCLKHDKGAFTGAIVQACQVNLASKLKGGTILLDEINEMDLSLQAKLPRVLQRA